MNLRGARKVTEFHVIEYDTFDMCREVFQVVEVGS